VHSIRARRRRAQKDHEAAAAASERATGWIMTFGLLWIFFVLLILVAGLPIDGMSLGSS
jgi:hypothetical protein